MLVGALTLIPCSLHIPHVRAPFRLGDLHWDDLLLCLVADGVAPLLALVVRRRFATAA